MATESGLRIDAVPYSGVVQVFINGRKIELSLEVADMLRSLAMSLSDQLGDEIQRAQGLNPRSGQRL